MLEQRIKALEALGAKAIHNIVNWFCFKKKYIYIYIYIISIYIYMLNYTGLRKRVKP